MPIKKHKQHSPYSFNFGCTECDMLSMPKRKRQKKVQKSLFKLVEDRVQKWFNSVFFE